MEYISYFYGTIYPICAESAVKHQLTNFYCSNPSHSHEVIPIPTRSHDSTSFPFPFFPFPSMVVFEINYSENHRTLKLVM